MSRSTSTTTSWRTCRSSCMTSRRRSPTSITAWSWTSPSRIRTATACSSRCPKCERAPHGARFALGTAGLRWRRARGAQVLDRAVVVDGEMIEAPRGAPGWAVAVAYAVVKEYPRVFDRTRNVVAVADRSAGLSKPYSGDGNEQLRQGRGVERLRRHERDEHVSVAERRYVADRQRVARDERVDARIARGDLATGETLSPRLARGKPERHPVKRRTAERVDLVDIHNRVPPRQRRCIVDRDERIVVRLDRSGRDRDLRSPFGDHVADRKAGRIVVVRGAHGSRQARVITARLDGTGGGGAVAGRDQGGAYKREAHRFHDNLPRPDDAIDDTFPSCLRVTRNVRWSRSWASRQNPDSNSSCAKGLPRDFGEAPAGRYGDLRSTRRPAIHPSLHSRPCPARAAAPRAV